MPSTRYILRLPSTLDQAVQERIQATGTPFAVLMREALSADLADTPPTGSLTFADSADILREVQVQLAALTVRAEVIEAALRALTTAPTPADRTADRPPIPADRRADSAPTGGRRGTMRARILALLQGHPEGLTADDIRFYLKPERPLGDTLRDMIRQGRLVRQGTPHRWALPGRVPTVPLRPGGALEPRCGIRV